MLHTIPHKKDDRVLGTSRPYVEAAGHRHKDPNLGTSPNFFLAMTSFDYFGHHASIDRPPGVYDDRPLCKLVLS